MTKLESLSLERSTENAPRGIEDLYTYYDEFNPGINVVNGAMVLEVTLRHTKNAVATGRDISILDTPSQELLTDLILDMPIGIREPHPLAAQLFNGLVEKIHADEQQTTEELIDFTRTIQAATSPYSTLEMQCRMELTSRLEPFIRRLGYTAQKLIDEELDHRRLGHEGASINSLHPDVYREFIDKEYLHSLTNREKCRDIPGLTGQVALRLMKESDWFRDNDIDQLIDLTQ